jgi:hypothetical protein
MTTRRYSFRASLVITIVIGLTIAASQLRADTGTCGAASVGVPFTDVAGNQFFCQIAEAYVCGLTNGTTATTYSPSEMVPREQMAAFITRAQDSALRRGSRRAALNQWATPQSINPEAMTTVGQDPQGLQSDGADIWVANYLSDTVSRVRASDGKLLDTWTGAVDATGVLVAQGRIYVSGAGGKLYRIDPKQPAGAVTVMASNLGALVSLTWDGVFIWTTSYITGGITKVNPETWTFQTFNAVSCPRFILFDGTNLWVDSYNNGDGHLHKLNPDGSIALTVDLNINDIPQQPVFDGTNIWVPSGGSQASSKVTVVRASTGAILATLTGNGLHLPGSVAFDGQRILVTNGGNQSVSLWRAADLTPIGSFPLVSSSPSFACSDGVNFWISCSGKIARF